MRHSWPVCVTIGSPIRILIEVKYSIWALQRIRSKFFDIFASWINQSRRDHLLMNLSFFSAWKENFSWSPTAENHLRLIIESIRETEEYENTEDHLQNNFIRRILNKNYHLLFLYLVEKVHFPLACWGRWIVAFHACIGCICRISRCQAKLAPSAVS